MALADGEDDIAGLGDACGELECATPVEFDAHVGAPGGGNAAQHRRDDRARVLRARVVGAEDRRVGGGDKRAQGGPLLPVSVAAAAGDNDQPPVRPQPASGREREPQGLGSVRVVDDAEHTAGNDPLHAAARAVKSGDCRGDGLEVFAKQRGGGGQWR